MAVVGSASFELRAERQRMKQDLAEAKRDLGGFVSDAEREVGGSTSRISGMMGKIGFAVTALSAAIGAGIALAIKFGGASLEMADGLANSANRIGISTTALQEWQYVARKTGQDASEVSGALEGFANKAGQAAAGLSKEAKDAFAAIGFTPDNLRSFKDTESLLDAVTDRIGELKSEADRAAIAEKLGLGPLATALREGSDETARLRDEAAALGFVMDDALIQKGAEAQGRMEDLSQIIGIQMATAFIGLSDEVIAFSGHVADAITKLNEFADRYKESRLRNVDEGQDDSWINNFGRTVGGDFTENLPWVRARNKPGSFADNMQRARALPDENNPDDPANLRLMDQSTLRNLYGGRLPGGRSSLTPAQPRGRADNSAEKARRAAEQEARRAERVEEEIARARLRVLGIVDDEAQTVQQRFDTAKAQVEAEREAEAKNLESRKARKDITKAEFDQLTLINTQTAALEDRVANDILARDLSDERLAKERALSDLTVDLLSIQAGSARTAGERARLERQLLVMAQRRARDDLETELARKPGLSEEYKQNRRGRLADFQRAQSEAASQQNLTPLQAWRDQSLKSIDEVNEAYENIAARGLDALNDGIVDAIMNSKNLGDVFSNVAKQIQADLLAISVRKGVTEPLANMLFGGEDGGGATGKVSAISSIVKSFLGSFGRRALGGPVSAGTPYVVGENRAELFIPSVPGTILPSIGGAAGGGMSRQEMAVHVTPSPYFDVQVSRVAGPMAAAAAGQAFGGARQAVPQDMAKTSRYSRGRR